MKSTDNKIVNSTITATILTTLVGMIGGFILGITIATQPKEKQWPVVDIPEELMCVTSEDPSKMDTVYAFQSKHNDTLFIRFKP